MTASGARSPLDVRAAARAAAITVAVAAVPIAAVRLVVGDEAEGGERNLWVVPVVALFVAFAVGGHLAARAGPSAPYRHAATSAGMAFAVFVVFTLARRLAAGDGLTVPLVVTLAVLGQVSVSFALLGGYVAWRRRR